MSDLEIRHPEFAKRLNEMMDYRGIDKVRLSESTGIAYEMIRRYSEGLAKPRDKNLRAISDCLDASISYLNYGELPKEKIAIDDLKAKIHSMENKVLNKKVLAGHELASIDDKEQSDMVPVISWVAAGSWTETMAVTMGDIITTLPRFPSMSEKVFGLVIRGRSMMPQFKPGDIIYVEPAITPWELQDGDLIVVQCNDGHEATFKQLIIGETSDDMYLKPLNPDWPEQKLVPMGECMLIGKAVKKVESL